jgi:DNA-directed RNA polymerase subunit RPC12/RpoP
VAATKQEMTSSIRCPHCRQKLVQKSEECIRVRIKGAITIGEDGLARAECYWCSKAVAVPLELSKSAMPPPRLVVAASSRGNS